MSAPRAPDVTVSVVGTDACEQLAACLRSLRGAAPGLDVETLVVDNASRDGTAKAIRAEFPEATVTRNESRRSFAANHNANLSRARGRHFCLLNDDTVLTPGALARLAARLDEEPSTGAVGGRAYWDAERRFLLPGLKAEGLGAVLYRSSALARFGRAAASLRDAWRSDWALFEATEPLEVRALVGACFLVRATVARSIGPLDESYRVAYEDDDWSRRVRRAGLRLEVVPGAEYVHLVGRTLERDPAYAKKARRDAERFHAGAGGPLARGALRALFAAARATADGAERAGLAAARRAAAAPLPRRNARFEWAPIPGATEYLLELAGEPTFFDKVATFTREPSSGDLGAIVARMPRGPVFFRASDRRGGSERRFREGAFVVEAAGGAASRPTAAPPPPRAFADGGILA